MLAAGIRFVDLFAGLGGFNLAASRLGGRCVFACEIDTQLRDLYKSNFDLQPVADIRDVRAADVPSHDLLCAGFPCQAFSKAGAQEGLGDRERGSVVLNMLKIVASHRPRFVLLENVAHFVKHDRGHTFERVEKELRAVGYQTNHARLSPHEFGVPQIRDRMFMVASLDGFSRFDWPAPTSNQNDLDIRTVLDKRPTDAKLVAADLLACIGVWQEFLQLYPEETKIPSDPIWTMEFGATYPYNKDALSRFRLDELQRARGACGVPLAGMTREQIKKNVPSHARAGQGAFPRWKKLFIEHNRKLYRDNRSWLDPWLPKIRVFPPSLQKLEWNCQGEERDIWKYVLQIRASGVRVKRPNTAPSLVAMTTTQVPIIAWERRYMTIRECARLQSMDGLKHLPDGSAGYRALGNAVNVKVASLILERLLQA